MLSCCELPGQAPENHHTSSSSYYDCWYQEGGWGPSTVISNAIGQGEILATPIQMANFTAAIANRGYYIKPHFKRPNDKITGDSIFSKNHTLPIAKPLAI